jgi:small subunit ribosomal protein S6
MGYPSSYTYESIYIIRPSVSESDSQVIHQKIDQVIQKFEGSLRKRDDWGIQEMAYEIDNEKSGRYVAIVYNGKGGVVEEIERHFKISDDVIRFLTVKVPVDYDYERFKKQVIQSEEEVKKYREFRKKQSY